jgi:hypothetical protein
MLREMRRHVEGRSDEYSKAMDNTMGANATIKGKRLVYNHEDGMNYDLITKDIIVGSCLQVPEDVDRYGELRDLHAHSSLLCPCAFPACS